MAHNPVRSFRSLPSAVKCHSWTPALMPTRLWNLSSRTPIPPRNVDTLIVCPPTSTDSVSSPQQGLASRNGKREIKPSGLLG
ncbi:hypothetical protein M758_UG027700 [Ceratodon purpureus]|nr:hypothetical protein M758_UG027700 [Ceratodon purpureus]